MGVTKRTVQRSMQKLVGASLIDREFEEASGRRVFRFDPLAAQLAHDLAFARSIQRTEGFDA